MTRIVGWNKYSERHTSRFLFQLKSRVWNFLYIKPLPNIAVKHWHIDKNLISRQWNNVTHDFFLREKGRLESNFFVSKGCWPINFDYEYSINNSIFGLVTWAQNTNISKENFTIFWFYYTWKSKNIYHLWPVS